MNTTGSSPASLEPRAHVLLIDDEKHLLEIMRNRLERLGFMVTAYSCGVQALLDIQKAPNKFQIVITDLTMPNLSGLEISRIIREIHPKLPIILCTGDCSLYTKDFIRACGVDQILLKPVSRQTLVKTLQHMLD